jgi:hypothetical protein
VGADSRGPGGAEGIRAETMITEAEIWLSAQPKQPDGKVNGTLVIEEGQRRGYCICPKPMRQLIDFAEMRLNCKWCGQPETRKSWAFWYADYAQRCEYCGFAIALITPEMYKRPEDRAGQCKSGTSCPFTGRELRYVARPDHVLPSEVQPDTAG